MTISDDDIAISVEGLGKSYLVGHNAKPEGYTALRDVLARGARDFARKARDMVTGRAIVQGDEVEEFWALKDVSFELKRGERLGIIGRNGAGKSTLLKLLSRITEPTEGRIRINGRVASLLEVGTGFHPELTGRENIFLNGAILGMSRKEIQRKFDEIVDFAEVEKFLDTPVKRYSSGMYVRLAFAVAAHLEPEILIVDEVLAVGDAQFQKKCLGKMEEVGREGRTVLFVSHNLSSIQNMCTQALLLAKGKLLLNGPPGRAIGMYLSEGSSDAASASLVDHPGRATGSDRQILRSISLRGVGGDLGSNVIEAGGDLIVEIGYALGTDELDCMVIGISSLLNERITTVGTHLSSECTAKFSGEGKVICRINRINLIDGEYKIFIAIARKKTMETIDSVEDAIRFRVESNDYFGTGKSLLPGQGGIMLKSTWTVPND